MMEQQPIRPRGEVNNHIRDLWKVSGDIPLGTKRSILYPTLRWGEPAYSFFVSPFAPRPNGKSRQAPPESWTALSAITLRVLIYARVEIVSFAPGRLWDSVQISGGQMSPENYRTNSLRIDELIDLLSPEFLRAADGNISERSTLLDLLRQNVPETIFDQTRCLVPDFFEWLYEPIRLNDPILR